MRKRICSSDPRNFRVWPRNFRVWLIGFCAVVCVFFPFHRSITMDTALQVLKDRATAVSTAAASAAAAVPPAPTHSDLIAKARAALAPPPGNEADMHSTAPPQQLLPARQSEAERTRLYPDRTLWSQVDLNRCSAPAITKIIKDHAGYKQEYETWRRSFQPRRTEAGIEFLIKKQLPRSYAVITKADARKAAPPSALVLSRVASAETTLATQFSSTEGELVVLLRSSLSHCAAASCDEAC
jgi:hypothetical protein